MVFKDEGAPPLKKSASRRMRSKTTIQATIRSSSAKRRLDALTWFISKLLQHTRSRAPVCESTLTAWPIHVSLPPLSLARSHRQNSRYIIEGMHDTSVTVKSHGFIPETVTVLPQPLETPSDLFPSFPSFT